MCSNYGRKNSRKNLPAAPKSKIMPQKAQINSILAETFRKAI
jgi:hypothetical protein